MVCGGLMIFSGSEWLSHTVYTFQDPRLVYVIADESLENDEEILFSRAFDVSVLRRHGDPEVVQPRTLKSIIVGASKKIGIWV